MTEEKPPTAPLAKLDECTARYRQTEDAHEQARQDVIAAALDALKARERPTDVAEHSPFTDAYIRRLARENGIKAHPRSKGPRPRTGHTEAPRPDTPEQG
jgi:hypothetical protein